MGKAGYIFPIEDAKHPDTMDSSFGRPSASFNIFNNDVTLIHSDMIQHTDFLQESVIMVFTLQTNKIEMNALARKKQEQQHNKIIFRQTIGLIFFNNAYYKVTQPLFYILRKITKISALVELSVETDRSKQVNKTTSHSGKCHEANILLKDIMRENTADI